MVKRFSWLRLFFPKAFRFRAIIIKPVRPRIEYETGPEPINALRTITTGRGCFFNAGDCGVSFRSSTELPREGIFETQLTLGKRMG